jgi:hypothetical protein
MCLRGELRELFCLPMLGNWKVGMVGKMLMCGMFRSLLYVEADARMESFTDKEGNSRSSLSLIASMYRD